MSDCNGMLSEKGENVWHKLSSICCPLFSEISWNRETTYSTTDRSASGATFRICYTMRALNRQSFQSENWTHHVSERSTARHHMEEQWSGLPDCRKMAADNHTISETTLQQLLNWICIVRRCAIMHKNDPIHTIEEMEWRGYAKDTHSTYQWRYR